MHKLYDALGVLLQSHPPFLKMRCNREEIDEYVEKVMIERIIYT